MRVPTLVLLACLAASAQTPPVPEVRGTVVETGTSTPIPGVAVSLLEFGPNAENFVVNKVVVSTSSDANGAYVLRPGHVGQFTLEAKKEGYGDKVGRILTLTQAEPAQILDISMTRPATLTGRVIDEDGNPVANLRVLLEHPSPTRFAAVSPYWNFESATTNAEGVFTGTVMPGDYRVHVGPEPASDAEDLAEYSEAAFETIDQDIEPSYWPGGVADPNLVLPITVTGGAIANVGTITVRKTPYYRVRLTLNRDCEPNERWTFRLRPAGPIQLGGRDDTRYTACRKDALLTGVPPGNYELAVWHGRDVDQWAMSPVTITKSNTTVPITFNTSPAVTGRVIAAGNGDLSKLGQVQVLLRSSEGFISSKGLTVPNAAGAFAFESVPWRTQWLSVQTMNPETYVKEIRYSGLPVRSYILDLIPGANLDVTLDSGAAKLSVTLKEGDAVVPGQVLLIAASVTEPPALLSQFPPFIIGGGGGPLDTETRTITNIPPGEYRVMPLPRIIDENSNAAAIAQRFARAEKITLGRGEQKSIEVQLK